MFRLSVLLFAVMVACGGKSAPPPAVPLPGEAKPESATPADKKPEPERPLEPAAPAGPLEVKLAPAQVTVKLVSRGKGKATPLKFSPKAGDKQTVELAMDFAGSQSQGDKSESQAIHTIVLTGEGEIKSVAADGSAQYALTINSTDVREVKTAQVPLDQFKELMTALNGLNVSGTLAPNGTSGEITLRIDKPTKVSNAALDLIKLVLPGWPVLPTEPVAPGAKWQTSATLRLADRLEVTQTTDYELVSRKGAVATLKGTTKVTGKDQDVEGGKISAISGAGTSEATLTEGSLYPTYKMSVETKFSASDGKNTQQFSVKVGGEVTPKK